MTGEIRTDPEQLIGTADRAEQQCISLSRCLDQISKLRAEKEGSWESEAGRQFQKELRKELILMRQVLAELRANYADLRQMAVNYSQAEAWLENTVWGLPALKED